MKRLALAVALMLLAGSLRAAVRAERIELVLYPGQQFTQTTPSAILQVSPVDNVASLPVAVRFERYGQTIRIDAKKPGFARFLVEHTDQASGQMLLVTVAKRAVHDRHEAAVDLLGGLEGFTARDVMIAGDDVIVAGTAYSNADLQRCIDLAKQPGVICASRLASAAAVIHPELPYSARASLAMTEDEPSSRWIATVRVGDVPVLRLGAADRVAAARKAAKLVAALNRVRDGWAAETASSGRMYPITFRATQTAAGWDLVSFWKFSQGRKGETLVSLTSDELRDAGDAAGVPPKRVVSWWAALLQDSFRAYELAERPARTSTAAKRSPLVETYEHALLLRGSHLDRDSAAVSLARAWFAEQLASGDDPFATLALKVPSDFAAD